jgi:hypothetical protein
LAGMHGLRSTPACAANVAEGDLAVTNG